MNKKNKEYKDILKSNAVFGGIKVFQLIITFLKGKIVAVLLGPAGVGIQTLLVTTISTIQQFSNLGFPQSSVRELSIENDDFKRRQIISVIQVIACVLGFISSLFCLLFSRELGVWIFGNKNYSWMFIVISVSLFFETLTAAQISILQGLRKVKILAQASLIGSLLSLIVTIPLYYFWRLNAIPFAITIGYIVSAIVLVIMAKIKIVDISKLNKGEFIDKSKKILSLGLTLMIGNCIMSVLSLALILFINKTGCNSDVGYYQAATNCTYMAINIIISVLASDYYPRISQISQDTEKMKSVISTQIELMLIILTPIVCIILSWPSFIIKLLYSSEFLIVERAVQIIAIALFFRVMWHSLSYVILAKGDKKTYLIFDAIIGNGIFFAGNMLGFYLDGINGIALSYILGSVFVFVLLSVVVKSKYCITISREVKILLALTLLVSLFLFSLSFYMKDSVVKNIMKIVFVFTTSLFAVYSLDKKTGFLTFVLNKFNK